LDKNIKIKPIIVDDILKERSEHHEKWVEAFHRSPEMQKRDESERQGLKDFLEGNYKPRYY